MIKECRHQYIEVTTVADNKTFICSKCGKIRKVKKYRNYIPESYLDNYEPLDNNDIDYINEL